MEIDSSYFPEITQEKLRQLNGNIDLTEVEALLPLNQVQKSDLEVVERRYTNPLDYVCLKDIGFRAIGAYKKKDKWFCLAEFKNRSGNPIIEEGELLKIDDSIEVNQYPSLRDTDKETVVLRFPLHAEIHAEGFDGRGKRYYHCLELEPKIKDPIMYPESAFNIFKQD